MATRPPATGLSYTMRRDEPTRIEGFSDAVFGFSLTLLAFSLEVPSGIEDLKTLVVAQLVPTLAAFALMCWIWAEHNSFFRQFGLQDGTTIVLNSILLFLVVFYTYPLKFMAVYLWALISSGFGWNGVLEALKVSGSLAPNQLVRSADTFTMMLIYNIGFVTLFGIFALLYRHALRQRVALGLDDVEYFEARGGLRVQLISVIIALVAIAALLVLPRNMAGISGMVYMLMGPAHGIHGARYAKARAKLIEARNTALNGA